MKSYIKFALSISIFVLIGFPIIFLIISLITGNWLFLISSGIPSFFAGLTGLLVTLHQIKKEKNVA
ncbi:hypothetical protein ACFOZY_00070 [Chungangia koreensis]|uniref:Uncharacterized protein n=1 Tax=Chungangia koreensis TaxID=752657 RepID=A0ABV8WYU1_9LACT